MKNLQTHERVQIQALHDAGKRPSEIANYLRRNPSTIYRELNRHSDAGGRYSYEMASNQAKCNMVREVTRGPSADTIAIIEAKIINEQWSPEQISGWLKKNDLENVSHTWIYSHIKQDKQAGGELADHLRHGSYSKEPREYKGHIKDRVTIEQRPVVANERQRLGDLEIDLIVGVKNRGAILSIIDRKSRHCILEKLSGKTVAEVTEAIVFCLASMSKNIFTMTSDNGTEFSDHKKIAEALGVQYYFANPYASYERGSIENLNGLVRQYIPKGTNFNDIIAGFVKVIENKLNNRPRKVLNYLTPCEYAERHKIEAA